jgi:hypothetical protein
MGAAVLASLESKNSRDVTQWASFAKASAKRRRVPRSRKGQCWPPEHPNTVNRGLSLRRVGISTDWLWPCPQRWLHAGLHSASLARFFPRRTRFLGARCGPASAGKARSRALSCMQRGAVLLGVSLRKILEYQMHASILVLFACGPSSTVAGTTVFTEIVPLPCARGRSPPWSAS